MASCPNCSRPVAMARPSCLYCGMELPAELVETLAAQPPPSLAAAAEPAAAVEPPERALIVARLDGVDPPALAAATGWSPLEARQHAARGGWSLLRIDDPAAAQAAVERYAAHGLRVAVLAMSEVRAAAEPWQALGARFDAGRLRVRGGDEELSVAPGDLELVVRGRIHREYQSRPVRARSLRTATLEQGFRFHLHRRGVPAPVELDPGGLEFDPPWGPGSSLLRVSGWVGELARDCPVDDHFRFVPPALSPSAEESGVLAAAASLRRGRGRRGGADEPVILDNLAQFRFYSAWRAVAERRCVGA